MLSKFSTGFPQVSEYFSFVPASWIESAIDFPQLRMLSRIHGIVVHDTTENETNRMNNLILWLNVMKLTKPLKTRWSIKMIIKRILTKLVTFNVYWKNARRRHATQWCQTWPTKQMEWWYTDCGNKNGVNLFIFCMFNIDKEIQCDPYMNVK